MNIFRNKKINIIMFIIVFVIICTTLIIVFSIDRKEKKEQEEQNGDIFMLDPIYSVYPSEVRELYSNVVSVSCMGDLKLTYDSNKDMINVKKMNSNDLLNYMFSYLDKNLMLNDQIDLSVIRDASDKLFAGDIDLIKEINNFQYGDYIYNLTQNVVTRTESECVSNDFKYVAQLYGFSYNEQQLSMDINIGYSKDGYLYDLADRELGKYSGDIQTLGGLFIGNSYYRYNYVLDGTTYKLTSVQWLNRSYY